MHAIMPPLQSNSPGQRQSHQARLSAQSQRDHRQRQRAFSLTELLVVIAIIALLVGILLTALAKVHRRAKRTSSEATMQAFSNACMSFQAEFGYYPGVIPDDVLFATPPANGISSTENALLHLMGGFRVLRPEDNDPANPLVADFNSYRAQAAGNTPPSNLDYTFGTSPNQWTLTVDTRKIGEGPVINGKPHAPYFTPSGNELAKVVGQLSDPLGKNLPDLVDSWGQPIIYCRQVRDRGPLLNDIAMGPAAAAPQFALGGVTDYLNSQELGELGTNPQANSMLALGSPDLQNNLFAVILSHPGFYKSANPLYGKARGAFLLISSGPDGIYFSKIDGPGSATVPLDAANVIPNIINAGPNVIDEFDDIRVFGGG